MSFSASPIRPNGNASEARSSRQVDSFDQVICIDRQRDAGDDVCTLFGESHAVGSPLSALGAGDEHNLSLWAFDHLSVLAGTGLTV